MKRFLCILLALIFSFIFSSCKASDTSSLSDSSVVTEVSTEQAVSENEETNSQEAQVSSEETVSSESAPSQSAPQVQSTPSAPAPTQTTVSTNDAAVQGSTYTGLPALEATCYTVSDPLNTRGLSTARRGFSFGVAKDSQPHEITVNNQSFFDQNASNALAWDNKSTEKVLYLTFDCGYRYQDLVPRILNTLEEKQVKAAFFLTMQYLKQAPSDVADMINKGHIVGNHTVSHPECPNLSREELADELLGVDNYLRTEFGYETKYFRYPSGAYSDNTLDLVKSIGYRTVFWSIAHTDWDPANQPGVEKSFQTVTSRLHPGAVILLHSTSPDNVEILGRFIDYARSEGYTFKALDEYAFWESNS